MSALDPLDDGPAERLRFVLVVESGEDYDGDCLPGRGVDAIYGPMSALDARANRERLLYEVTAFDDSIEPTVTIVPLSSWDGRPRLRDVDNVVESL